MPNRFKIQFLLLLIICVTLMNCASIIPIMKPVSIIEKKSLGAYKYVFIPQTNTLSSGTGIYYGLNGTNLNKSINPSDVIAGLLIKKSFIRLNELNPALLNQTMIVNFGESGRRETGLGGYTIEITLQFISADNKELIVSCTAEGQGSTEADDIRIAIERCIKELLK